jgi:hypothetical protein
MFQIIAKSLRIAARTDTPKPCLPREADLPRLNVPLGWGSLRAQHPQADQPSARQTRRATLAPCNP